MSSEFQESVPFSLRFSAWASFLVLKDIPLLKMEFKTKNKNNKKQKQQKTNQNIKKQHIYNVCYNLVCDIHIQFHD